MPAAIATADGEDHPDGVRNLVLGNRLSRGKPQGPHTVRQRLQQRGGPPHDGQPQHAPAVREQAQRFAQDRDPAIGAADGNGERPRGAHHDALDHRLPADQWLAHPCFTPS